VKHLGPSVFRAGADTAVVKAESQTSERCRQLKRQDQLRCETISPSLRNNGRFAEAGACSLKSDAEPLCLGGYASTCASLEANEQRSRRILPQGRASCEAQELLTMTRRPYPCQKPRANEPRWWCCRKPPSKWRQFSARCHELGCVRGRGGKWPASGGPVWNRKPCWW